MTTQLLLAPAAAGKTAYVLERVREAARGLRSTPRVLVPTLLQGRAWRRRLAEAGGAIGVQVLTYDRLYAQCLNAAGEAYTQLSDPVQYRLIRSLVDGLGLAHYAPLVPKPGFIQVLQRLIAEAKSARIEPELLLQAVKALGGEPRLVELAQIYAAYQLRLQAQGWADRAGLGWLAVEALEQRAPGVARDWPLLAVDGFDSFTSVQLAMLKVLAGRVERMLVTLTGTAGASPRPLVHDRFARTRGDLEQALGVQATPLPEQCLHHHPDLAHLEAGLFVSPPTPHEPGQAVTLVEAPDRATEVREALRWLKARLVLDGLGPEDVALLARSVRPYRPFIGQIAAEFGLPVRLIGGLPLASNPAVAALLDLLRLMLPQPVRTGGPGGPEPALPRRGVVEAWRSPYFDWSVLADGEEPPGPGQGAGGLSLADADALDAAARWGRVIGGLSQWHEALSSLASLAGAPLNGAQMDGGPVPTAGPEAFEPGATAAEGHAAGLEVAEPAVDEEQGWPRGLPKGAAAQALLAKFRRFVRRLTPPESDGSYRAYVCWLEDLIGHDPDLQSPRFPAPAAPESLGMVARARRSWAGAVDVPPGAGGEAPATPTTGERDVAALRALKEILRGLVWAEQALGEGQPIDYRRFFDELAGAVDAATYDVPPRPGHGEIVGADVVQARGVPFRAVAVLGLAEGEFPAPISEDPFLPDADRRALQAYGVILEPSTESAEAEFFYETITRPRERLLLTRPRLADNGALWPASPFWEEVRRLLPVRPETLTSELTVPPGRVASWPELMESLATHARGEAVRRWVLEVAPERYLALAQAARILLVRSSGQGGSSHDGDLRDLAGEMAQRFGPGHTWSASGLESYRGCPFAFYVARVLGLEPREEPAEGLDSRQLGTIYHRILERVYGAPGVSEPNDLGQLLHALPGVGAAVLDAAPAELGFRETAWWAHTRAEILENVRRSLEQLAALPGEFVPLLHEAAFGLHGQPALAVHQGTDRFWLRGYIDRVDRAPDGRVRVIDYKTAGPTDFAKSAVAGGKKLQIPLYALAARDALGAGQPVEGFYWHVRHAEKSGFSLSGFPGGPDGAMDVAVEKAWEAVRGVREGHFVPQRPDGNCPSWCPAAGFCWHFVPRFGG